MKKIVFTLGLVVAHTAAALSFSDVLSAAPGRPDAVSAQLRLINAESTMLRTEADPLALRIDRLQAAQAAELAGVELRQARLTAIADLAEAYGNVLVAHMGQQLAADGLDLAESGLQIAEIRFANGSATQLDLRDAQVAVDEAAAGLQTAGSALRLAVSNLEGMIGETVDPEQLDPLPVGQLPALPDLDAVLSAALSVPQLLQVEHGLELATAAVEMLDPSYASAAQIENARTQLETTEQLASEARRGIQLMARNLHLTAQNALANLEVERDAHANAAERHEFERQRLEGGLISEIAFRQSALQLRQAELSLLQAESAALTELFRLSAGSLVGLSGPLGQLGDR